MENDEKEQTLLYLNQKIYVDTLKADTLLYLIVRNTQIYITVTYIYNALKKCMSTVNILPEDIKPRLKLIDAEEKVYIESGN